MPATRILAIGSCHRRFMLITAALEQLDGVARTHQLSEFGITAATIRTATDRGLVQRLRKGVYALDAHATVSVAAAHGGHLTCVSVLQELGLWLLNPPAGLHVDVGRKGRIFGHSGCSCVDHHSDSETAFGRVGCVEALLAAMRCLSHEEFFAAFESAWRRRLISQQDRDRIIWAAPATLAGLLRFARGDADSGLESIFRFRLLQLGIQLESQVTIDGIGRVDFRYKDVLFEIDGKLNHDGTSERHKDLLRDAAAARLGYRVLRFNYAMIVHDWDTVIATVRCAIARAQAAPAYG